MTHLNAITLIGRAGKDPEMRFFESGAIKCALTMAVNRPNNEDKPDWFDLDMWGKTAEIAGEYIRKGQQFAVEGTFGFQFWKDKTTLEDRSRPIVRVDRIELLASSRSSNSDENFGDED
jgi:single-strand DNA-binding protein